ncbi:MAG: right-handed parallel beta-helix repeat-containing protein [Pirellulaceae bacterium]|nr:right-handed parallel beta-helix repeat-containing protein [Pirellulaceae bacterium]
MPFQNRRPRITLLETFEPRVVFATNVWVDPINGNDGNDGLSPAAAIRTLNKVVSQYDSLKPAGHIELAPGDTVILMPGEHHFAYRYGEGQWQGLFLRNVHGTADKPITIRGMDGTRIDNRAPDGTEMSTISIIQSSHIVIENLDVTSYGSAINVGESSDVAVRNNFIHDVDGVAANNLSGVYLAGVQNTVVENNLFTDNYDRSRPGNANNRHIVIFGGVDVKILGNTMRNSNPQAGMAVDYKHLGGLSANQVGDYEVAYNTIINAAGTAIGTAAPNSYIHHNLLIDSGSIRVADLGGTNQLANERIEYNTIVNSLDRLDGGGLSYYPNEYSGYPLGDLYWSHNLVVDNRQYDHSEKATVTIDRYGPDDFYRRAIDGGLFHADGNVYQTKDAATFDIYGANGGRYGQLGSNLSFADWQAAGYDTTGSVSLVGIDANYRDTTGGASKAGIYAGNQSRLTVLLDKMDIDEAGLNSIAKLNISRGDGTNQQALRVTITTSKNGEILVPQEVVIPAGQHSIDVTIEGIADGKLDNTQAIRIEAIAAGFDHASAWVRLHDSPIVDQPAAPDKPIDGVFKVPGLAGESVSLQSSVSFRGAEYNNEMGVAYVDHASGRVGDLMPSDRGWLKALLGRGQNFTVLNSGVKQGDIGQVQLTAGRHFVFYLVQDNSLVEWQIKNPTNDLSLRPQVFTSIESSNSDRFDHVHESVSVRAIDLAWEDIEFGGDESFTDLVVHNAFETQQKNYCEAVDDFFSPTLRTVPEGKPIELDVLKNDKFFGPIKIIAVDQPSTGTVVISESGTKLIYTPSKNYYGGVKLRYQIESEGSTSFASVELTLRKPWTNELKPSDVNGDGRVTPLDLLSVINALSKHPSVSLTPFPVDDTRHLTMIDVNSDGILDVNDALALILALLSDSNETD